MGPPGAVLLLDGGSPWPGVAGRPTFAGFSSAVAVTSIGGRHQANAMCASQFAGSHVCTGYELLAARPATTLAPPGAFIDSFGDATTREPATSGSCRSFQTASASYSAYLVLPGGELASNSSSSPNCTSTLPLACCSTPTAARLRGFSTPVLPGAIAGRMAANAQCASEFPGSHVCTGYEVLSARSPLPIPAPGVFIDSFGDPTTRDPATSGSCRSFQTASTSYSAYLLLPGGELASNSSSSPNCTNTLPLACCD